MTKKKYSKILITIIFVSIIFLIFYVFLENKNLFSITYLLDNYLSVKEKVLNNFVLYYLTFFFLYFSISVLALPVAGLLCLLIGALFGFFYGIILASFASSLGALVCFLLSRYLFKSYIENRFDKTIKKINRGIETDGIYYLFFVRMTPIFPFFLINIIFSVTKIKAYKFYIFSQIGMLFGTALFINAGTQISKINSVEDIFSNYVIISIILIAIFPLILKKAIERIRGKL